MSANKADYPNRPFRKGARPKGSEHIHSKRKTWLSLGNVIDGGRDISPRLGFPWWKSPMMKQERIKNWL